jgi:glycosyltransferase involved in cell wall biosynthesis
MNKPIVTVVLATYNGARFLPEQLRSLAWQIRRPDRLVLRDDGSSDNSVELVRRWADSATIPLQIVTTGRRLGPAQSFLQALKAAEPADIFMFADQDDVWLPLKIERALGFVHWGLEAPPMLYASRLVVVSEQLQMTGVTPRPTELSFNSATCESVLTGCTMALNSNFRDSIIQAIPQHAAMHDWWLYLLATSSATLIFDDTPTVLYRQHSYNAVGAGAVGWARMRERVARFVGPDSTTRSRQLQEFLDLYGPRLQPPALSLLHQLLSARHSMAARLMAAFLAPIRRQSLASRISTRLALLTNRF